MCPCAPMLRGNGRLALAHSIKATACIACFVAGFIATAQVSNGKDQSETASIETNRFDYRCYSRYNAFVECISERCHNKSAHGHEGKAESGSKPPRPETRDPLAQRSDEPHQQPQRLRSLSFSFSEADAHAKQAKSRPGQGHPPLGPNNRWMRLASNCHRGSRAGLVRSSIKSISHQPSLSVSLLAYSITSMHITLPTGVTRTVRIEGERGWTAV